MEKGSKNRAVSLGIRIGCIFLMAVIALLGVAYLVLSKNFHHLMSTYTIELVQTMLSQGVETVEYELEAGRKEVTLLADSFGVPTSAEQLAEFSQALSRQDALRMTYVSKTHTISSDGRERVLQERPDIRAALAGETASYGPYFNEEKEFVICYSAPIRDNGRVAGVLSIEKDGYRFCELIKNIRFIKSGEAYIINAEGTDIAVSDPEHIDWVNSEYNAQKLLNDNPEDTITRIILELERKGLQGESGVGTYYWKDSLCYVVYAPIPSVGWVLLGGVREEEIASMTQSALFASFSKGPTLKISFVLFLLLTGLIVFWIISSMKKNAEINEKLEIIANHDPLTGLLNRRFLETGLTKLWKYPIRVSGQAAVFMLDIDNFKKYNDFYGHPKGDDCLRRVASVIKSAFAGHEGEVLRYGGEEFIAVAFLMERQTALEQGVTICRLVENEKLPDSEGGFVTVSVGVCHVQTTLDASLHECIHVADTALYRAKKEGKNRAVLLDISSHAVSSSQADAF